MTKEESLEIVSSFENMEKLGDMEIEVPSTSIKLLSPDWIKIDGITNAVLCTNAATTGLLKVFGINGKLRADLSEVNASLVVELQQAMAQHGRQRQLRIGFGADGTVRSIGNNKHQVLDSRWIVAAGRYAVNEMGLLVESSSSNQIQLTSPEKVKLLTDSREEFLIGVSLTANRGVEALPFAKRTFCLNSNVFNYKPAQLSNSQDFARFTKEMSKFTSAGWLEILQNRAQLLNTSRASMAELRKGVALLAEQGMAEAEIERLLPYNRCMEHLNAQLPEWKNFEHTVRSSQTLWSVYNGVTYGLTHGKVTIGEDENLTDRRNEGHREASKMFFKTPDIAEFPDIFEGAAQVGALAQ